MTKLIVPAIIIAIVAVSLILFPRFDGRSSTTATGGPSTDFGVTYLTINPEISSCYSLGVNSGALVTEVAAGSIADKAGLRSGDIILTYNGVALKAGVPLLKVIRGCRPGSIITIEVRRGSGVETIRFVHPPI